ncbi:MAG: homoserine kinase [Chitinophagia bacterium]|jgi:homoserine kinase|nr:homoserine kinase [Chitinophagia bacterium]
MVPIHQWIKIKAPATVANMVCGFDILGFAVCDPYDEMEMRLVPRAENVPAITIINIDEYNLPTQPEKNVAGAALLALLEESPKEFGFEVKINKLIKPGSGVGSSAASSAGAVVGANYLLGNIFSKDDLVRFAMNGEKVASGVKHADNIAPCIHGGVTLVRSIFPLEIITLPSPQLYVTIVHPQIEVRTSDARSILRQQVLLKDAIKQWGNIAGLVAGLMKSDYDLIGRSLEDVIIEPVRSILIPGFDELKKQCKEAGALGGGISGSGPSIFMLSKTKDIALLVQAKMKALYDSIGLPHHTYVTTINPAGVEIETKN